MSTDLARHAAVHELVAAFQSAEKDVRRAFAMIIGAEEHLTAVLTLGGPHDIHVKPNRHTNAGRWDVEEAVEAMAREAWGVIADRLELRRLLSVRRWEELDKRLRSGELPAVTLENVADFGQFYLDHARDMHAEAVGEVFNWLRPWRDTYKTNSKTEIGPKVVLENVVELCAYRKTFEVNHYRKQNLAKLDAVFHSLDGRGEVGKTHYGELHDAIVASGAKGVGETRYFKFRCFKNRNLHVEFKRADLLARFNAVAGGKNLKPENAGADGRSDGLAVA